MLLSFEHVSFQDGSFSENIESNYQDNTCNVKVPFYDMPVYQVATLVFLEIFC